MQKDMMTKVVVSRLLVLMIGVSVVSALNIHAAPCSPLTDRGNWLYVGGSGLGNFSTIQDAINESHDGDTVFVYDDSSPYGPVVIDTSIYLVGEQRNTTVLDGCDKGDTVCIESEGVVLSNFTITNGDGKDLLKDYFRAGVRITASNCTISHNIFRNNRIGVFGLRVTNVTVANNHLYDDGIVFSPYENDGRPPILERYFLHTITNNSINGKPFYYFYNQSDIIVPSDVGQVLAVHCDALVVTNASFCHVDNAGIILAFCSGCRIENTTFSDNGSAWFFSSDSNIIRFNMMCRNFHGICLDYGSQHNTISSNTFSDNQMAGVMAEYFSNGNSVEKNNFINNHYHAYAKQSFRNRWTGNYWDDWIGLRYPFLTMFPKCIRGQLVEGKKLPLITFDWRPALEPYGR